MNNNHLTVSDLFCHSFGRTHPVFFGIAWHPAVGHHRRRVALFFDLSQSVSSKSNEFEWVSTVAVNFEVSASWYLAGIRLFATLLAK